MVHAEAELLVAGTTLLFDLAVELLQRSRLLRLAVLAVGERVRDCDLVVLLRLLLVL
jgi:hypothetical protein